MDFYRVMVSFGKRKLFACGCLAEMINYNRTSCPSCGIEWAMPDHNKLFNDKSWNMKIYMSRDHYADFIASDLPGSGIVSEHAKKILMENFNNTIDFGNIEMISFRNLTDQKLKEIRDDFGYAAVKKIPNDPPQYYRMLLKQGADLDFEKSNIKLILDCHKCGRKNYDRPRDTGTSSNIYIIESTWKYYDLFHVEGKGNTIFCSERFIDIYDQNKLTGLEFEKVQTVR